MYVSISDLIRTSLMYLFWSCVVGSFFMVIPALIAQERETQTTLWVYFLQCFIPNLLIVLFFAVLENSVYIRQYLIWTFVFFVAGAEKLKERGLFTSKEKQQQS